MYRKLTALALALAIVASGFAFTNSRAAAQQEGNPQTDAAVAFLGGLVTVLLDDINVNDNTVQVGLVNVSRSLNSLRVLNNVLRNADIIDDITIQNVSILNNNEVLRNAFQNFLNENDINLNTVVGVAVLGDGVDDLLIITRQR